MTSESTAEKAAGAILTVDLGALAANYALLCEKAAGAEVSAVVKADAYGLGARDVAQKLSRAGCATFFVAHLEEGLEVRRAVGSGPRIFVLNGPGIGDMLAYRDPKLTAVLSSEAHVEMWTRSPGASCALHFDTGMNRLGLDPALLETRLEAFQKLQPVLVMSHLACADTPDHPMNWQQLSAFSDIAAAFLERSSLGLILRSHEQALGCPCRFPFVGIT